MSTKSLARTPLEAGHYGHGTGGRAVNRRAVKSERQQSRMKLRAVDDDGDAHVPKAKLHVWNSDRLGAIKRWVLSQCGRPWDKVYSDISSRFDLSNYTGGQHILQHVRGYVDLGLPHQQTGSTNGVRHRYPAFVNEAGILMKNKHYRHYSSYPETAAFEKQRQDARALEVAVSRWRRGRHMGREGALLFWYDISTEEKRVWCEDQKCWRPHYFVADVRECPHFDGAEKAYRYHFQRGIKATRLEKLTKQEQAFYYALVDAHKPPLSVENGFVSSFVR